MPKNVRNFWLNLTVDGKKEPVATGPRGAEGGFVLNVYQRDQGEVADAGQLQGDYVDGELWLTWTSADGNTFKQLLITKR